MTEQFFISSGTSLYCCTRYGRGPSMVVCFHGYGEEGSAFAFLEIADLERFSFYCPDLPGHGLTTSSADDELQAAELLMLVKEISKRHAHELQAEPGAVNGYTLLGFSLGGRVALRLYEEDPGSVERLVLLAPDGLKFNFWYSFSTGTVIGQWLFKFTVSHGSWFFAVLGFASRLKLVNAGLIRFVRAHLDSPESRGLLYKRWMKLRHMNPSPDKVGTYINEHNTQTRLVYGLYDRIITPAAGRRLLKRIEPNGRLVELGCGHQLLQVKNLPEISRALLH